MNWMRSRRAVRRGRVSPDRLAPVVYGKSNRPLVTDLRVWRRHRCVLSGCRLCSKLRRSVQTDNGLIPFLDLHSLENDLKLAQAWLVAGFMQHGDAFDSGIDQDLAVDAGELIRILPNQVQF